MQDDRINEIFQYIENANIDLDEDPFVRGPRYLQRQIAKCRNFMNEVQKFDREVAKERLTLERHLASLDAEYKVKADDLLVNDTTVSKQPSLKDREAKINTILKDLVDDIHQANLLLTDIKHVDTVIQSKIRELKSVNNDIRLQIRLMENELKIGGGYGDHFQGHEKKGDLNEVDLESLVPNQDDIPSFGEPFENRAEDIFGEDDNPNSQDDYEAILEDVPDASSQPPKSDPQVFDVDVDFSDLFD